MIEECKVNYEDRTEWRNLEGLLHRIDGPAVEWSDGSKEWYVNGEWHRIDGPAVVRRNEYKTWWVNGQLHRVDGPAVVRSNGTKEWWIEGEDLTEDEFNRKVNPIQELTVEEISNLQVMKSRQLSD